MALRRYRKEGREAHLQPFRHNLYDGAQGLLESRQAHDANLHSKGDTCQ